MLPSSTAVLGPMGSVVPLKMGMIWHYPILLASWEELSLLQISTTFTFLREISINLEVPYGE